MTITFTDGRTPNDKGYDWGVWVNGKPAGRLRIHDGQFRAFTNKREPGKAFLGTYRDREAAGRAVAQAQRELS